MRLQLLHVPDCPFTPRVRALLQQCLQQAGIAAPIEESEGPYPSPTLLIDGLDVTTGKPPSRETCCRLDLPTGAQIRTALAGSPAVTTSTPARDQNKGTST